MRKTGVTLMEIKQQITMLKGKDIDMQVNRGRKKIENYSGVIDNIYPSVFTVKLAGRALGDMATYSYSDVLCGDVKINEAQV